MGNNSGVYRITHKPSGRTYIGSSNDCKTRWRNHRNDLRKNNHHCIWLQNVWNKYDESEFVIELIQCVINIPHLFAIEQTYIDYYLSLGKLLNSEFTAGAPPSRLGKAPWNKGLKGCYSHTPEVKEICRQAALTNTNRNYQAFLDRAKRVSVAVDQIKDGIIINTFASISEAARAVNGQTAHICNVLKGTRRTHKGSSWAIHS